MPEIKNTFTQGKMNKDLDERLVPKGQYRDAMNVQVSTSEGSDVGTVQNILGNTSVETVVGAGFKCIGSVADEKNNKIYWFVTSDNKDAILQFESVNGNNICLPVFVDTNPGTINAVLKFPNSMITGINIIDDLLLWTDNVNEPRKISIKKSLKGTDDINTNTKLVVDDVILQSGGVDIFSKEENIVVIKKRPLSAPTIIKNVREEEDKDTLIFEKTFIRFCLRYKYSDGEYSAFGPFTSLVFEAGEFNLPINETYNSGMLNTIKSISIKDFVTPQTPEDVVQIDILYKEEDSSVIYSVNSIVPTDDEWKADGSYSSGQLKGSYDVTTENIYAALPSNQFLRVWDNVPKKALAQEVTGNRVVYGNYTQGYNLDNASQQKPKITVGYEERQVSPLSIDVEVPGLPSVKSQRNYQLGVVYGDEYGRETPVFTSSQGAVTIPWEKSNVDGGESSLNTTASNQLTTVLESTRPSWADYYKIFVKETSGDYHNLLMDKVYPNNFEIEEEEKTIWMSFPSSDRNKIQEEDYIILKNKRSTGDKPTPVTEENKFKVLDIKNEAPDIITYDYVSIGTVANSGNVAGVVDDVFDDPANTINGHSGTANVIKMNMIKWHENDGLKLDPDNIPDFPLYLSFRSHDVSINSSKKYSIASVTNDGQDYTLRLKEPILGTDSWATTDLTNAVPPANVTNGAEIKSNINLSVTIEKREKKDLNEFTGRFFVKIASTAFTRKGGAGAIEPEFEQNVSNSLTTQAQASVNRYVNSGLANYNGLGSSSSILPTSHTPVSKTTSKVDWTTIPPGWFIDSLFVKAGQRNDNDSVAASGKMWYGGNSGIGAGGENEVNGLEGIIQAGDDHVTQVPDATTTTGFAPNYGPRNWLRLPVYQKYAASTPMIAGNRNPSAISNNRPDRNRSNTYGSNAGKYYIHLTFNRPGKDLHDGLFSSQTLFRNYSDKPESTDSFNYHLQNIKCSASWTRNTNAQYHDDRIQCDNSAVTHKKDNNTRDASWDPGHELSGPNFQENKLVISRLKKGQKFKFSGDTSSPQEVYTIKKDAVVKYLYNHTSWNMVYEYDNTNVGSYLKEQDNCVERAAIDYFTNKTAATFGELKTQIANFGENTNRRVCYIIEVDKNPADSDYDPVDGTNITSSASDIIQFVSPDVDAAGILSRSKISVWETEPNESVDLNIYYESTDAIPLELTDENNTLFCKPGDKIELYNDVAGEDWVSGDVVISEAVGTGWADADTLNVSGIRPIFETGNWIGKSIGLPDPDSNLGTTFMYADYTSDPFDVFVKVYKQGSGFYTAKVIGHRSANTRKSVTFNSATSAIPFVQFLVLDKDHHKHPVGLDWSNCVSFGNGVESSKIKDDFNGTRITNGARANATLEEPYQEENRKSGLIYSGLYNSTNGVNNLNQFITAEKITKDLNPTYGSIQKLFSRRISLIAFCEDRVVGITANKNALYNADGNPQVVASNAVLGDANPFVGDYGISKNPESFAKQSYRAYFTDKQRGAVIRLSMDGLTPISDAGMHDYFRDNLKLAGELIGTYDEHKENYNLTLNNYLPTNLITNAEIVEGDAFTSYRVGFDEFITDGNLTTGTDWAPPLPWAQVATINGNPTIDTTTEIILHAAIAAVPPNDIAAIDEIPASSEAFALNYVTSPRDVFYPGIDHLTLPFITPGTGYASRIWYLSDDPALANVNTDISIIENNKWNYNSTDKIYAKNVPAGYGAVTIPHDNMSVLNNEVITFKASVSPTKLHADLTAAGVDASTDYISYRLELLYEDASGNDIIIDPSFLAQPLVPGTGVYEEKGYVDLIDHTALNANGTSTVPGSEANGTRTFVNFQYYWKFKSVDQVEYASAGGKISDGVGGRYNLPITPGDTGYITPKGFSAKDTYKNSYTVLYDDLGTQVGPSATVNADGNYDAVDPMPQPGPDEAENRRVVYDNLKFKLTAWFTNGATHDASLGAPSTGPDYNIPIPSGNTNQNLTYTPQPGNAGTGQVSFYISYIAGWKQNWYSGHGWDTGNNYALSESTSTQIQTAFAGQAGQAGSYEGETQQPVPAWVEVLHSSADWSVDSSGGTVDEFSEAEAEYGQATTTVAASLSSVNGSPDVPLQTPGAFLLESDLGNGFLLYADPNAITGTQSTNDVFIINSTGPTSKMITQDIAGTPWIVGDWYEVRARYGVAGSGATPPTGSAIVYGVLDPAAVNSTTLLGHIGEVAGGNNIKGIKLADNNDGQLRGYFKLHASSDRAVNLNEFKLQFYDFNGTIDGITYKNISLPGTGGGVGTNWSNGSLNIGYIAYDSLGGDGGTLPNLEHMYQVPQSYYQGGKYNFVNAINNVTYQNRITQDFDDFYPGDNFPQPTDGGYELKFTISEYDSGILSGYLVNGTSGFTFTGIQNDGSYTIKANTDGLVTGTTSISRGGIPYASGSVLPGSGHSSGWWNKLNFYVSVGDDFTGSIDNISLRDATNVLTGGGVDFWNFTGFDVSLFDYIAFDSTNYNILFTDAPAAVQLEQFINKTTYLNESYRVKFDYDISGTISGYYFNNLGQGFAISSLTGSGSYDQLHEIGVATRSGSELSSTFVINVETEFVNGTLDNFVMQQEFPDFDPSTITFNEGVKGWTSFKSFIPESGVSVSKNYYTMKEGKLWGHHIPQFDGDNKEINRNTFYNTGAVESTITSVLNDQPSIVKIFNTLGYEGSQSKVNLFETDPATGETNIGTHNLNEKKGWYVEEIITDKQQGSIREFIEKEGKWFNYISGKSGPVKTADFSFQGLGIINIVE